MVDYGELRTVKQMASEAVFLTDQAWPGSWIPLLVLLAGYSAQALRSSTLPAEITNNLGVSP